MLLSFSAKRKKREPDHLGSSNYITNASGEVYKHEEYAEYFLFISCLVPGIPQSSLRCAFRDDRACEGYIGESGEPQQNPEISRNFTCGSPLSPIILKNRLSSRITPMLSLCDGRRNEGSPRISRMPVKWDIIDIIIANFEALGLDGAVFTAGKSGKMPYGQINKVLEALEAIKALEAILD